MVSTVSPGANFALIARNSLMNSRRIGFYSTLGLSMGLLTLVIFYFFGVEICQKKYPFILSAMRIFGCGFLVYLGAKSFLSSKKNLVTTSDQENHLSARQAFNQGYITATFNPQTFLFIMATMSLLPSHLSYFLEACYGAEIIILETLWFFVVAFFLTTPRILGWIDNKKNTINRVSGGFLIFSGILIFYTTVLR